MMITLFFMLYRSLPARKGQEYQKEKSVVLTNKNNDNVNVSNKTLVKKTVTNAIVPSVKDSRDTSVNLSANDLTKKTPRSLTKVSSTNTSSENSTKILSKTNAAEKQEANASFNTSENTTADTTTNELTDFSANTLINRPVNISDYKKQIENIRRAAPALYQKNKRLYQAINNWINQSLNIDEFSKVGLNKYKLTGGSNFRNILLTGYYTPIVKARRKPDDQFKYPIYKMPTNLNRLPSRELIYKGALAGKGLELAYSDSLMGNFMMDIQGSAYIDFEDGSPLVYFSYAGRNGYDYSSLGRVLIEKGEVKRNQLSMQSVLAWAENQEEDKLKNILMQNSSFIFYNYQSNSEVKGSSGVPLIPNASVASDRALIPSGSVMLVNVPLLDDNGKYQGKNETRLMVALDTGSAIKGQHLDLYFGTGDNAGKEAGFYSHYAPVWLIKP